MCAFYYMRRKNQQTSGVKINCMDGMKEREKKFEISSNQKKNEEKTIAFGYNATEGANRFSTLTIFPSFVFFFSLL